MAQDWLGKKSRIRAQLGLSSKFKVWAWSSFVWYFSKWNLMQGFIKNIEVNKFSRFKLPCIFVSQYPSVCHLSSLVFVFQWTIFPFTKVLGKLLYPKKFFVSRMKYFCFVFRLQLCSGSAQLEVQDLSWTWTPRGRKIRIWARLGLGSK